jgi:hypothetical protein
VTKRFCYAYRIHIKNIKDIAAHLLPAVPPLRHSNRVQSAVTPAQAGIKVQIFVRSQSKNGHSCIECVGPRFKDTGKERLGVCKNKPKIEL